MTNTQIKKKFYPGFKCYHNIKKELNLLTVKHITKAGWIICYKDNEEYKIHVSHLTAYLKV